MVVICSLRTARIATCVRTVAAQRVPQSQQVPAAFPDQCLAGSRDHLDRISPGSVPGDRPQLVMLPARDRMRGPICRDLEAPGG